MVSLLLFYVTLLFTQFILLLQAVFINHNTLFLLRNEDLIIPGSMTQDFGFTGMLGKQAHSKLRNCFSSATVEPKDKSDSGIIEFSFLSTLTVY